MVKEIRNLTQQIRRRKTMLYIIGQASKGNPAYLKAYPDPERRARRAIVLVKEIQELKTKREKIDKDLGIKRSNTTGRPEGYFKAILAVDSYGNTWTQKEIDKKRSEAYRIKYQDNPNPIDEGFREKRAQCTAHIIPQARCKQLGKTELIWDIDNMFAATFESNAAIENPKGQAWKKLHNKQYCLNFMQKHDPELYAKFMVNS